MNLGMGLYLSQRSDFSPAALASIAHWYRRIQGITIATGVSQWNDLIGTAHLIQSTGANQPAYNATDAGYNGQATVQSTATNMFLVSGAAAVTQPCSVLVVGQINTIGRLIASLGTSGALAPSVFFASWQRGGKRRDVAHYGHDMHVQASDVGDVQRCIVVHRGRQLADGRHIGRRGRS